MVGSIGSSPAAVAKPVEIVFHVSIHALSRRARGLPIEVIAGGRRPAGETLKTNDERAISDGADQAMDFGVGILNVRIRSRDIVISGVVPDSMRSSAARALEDDGRLMAGGASLGSCFRPPFALNLPSTSGRGRAAAQAHLNSLQRLVLFRDVQSV